jgi:hypothetical protein
MEQKKSGECHARTPYGRHSYVLEHIILGL